MWWKNPLRYVDADDLLDSTGSLTGVTVHNSLSLLRDMAVARPTENAAIGRLFHQSLKNVPALTKRQQDALLVAQAAAMAGLSPVKLVGQELKINRHSAHKLLRRIDERMEAWASSRPLKMETIAQNAPFIYKRRDALDETAVRRVLHKMRVECVACGAPGCRVDYGLCRHCFEKYGADGERGELTERWLTPLLQMMRRQARQEAREQLMTVALWDDD
jgi:hypothetical protein